MLKASCSAVLILALGACTTGNAQVSAAQQQADAQAATAEVGEQGSFELLAVRMVEAGDHAAAIPLYRHILKTNMFNSATLRILLGENASSLITSPVLPRARSSLNLATSSCKGSLEKALAGGLETSRFLPVCFI